MLIAKLNQLTHLVQEKTDKKIIHETNPLHGRKKMFSGHIFMLDFLKMKPITWQDKEDSGDKGQDGAMRPDVADIAEHKADEHEEKADQRERSGRADHLCKQADKKSPSVLLCFFTLKLRVKLLAFFS